MASTDAAKPLKSHAILTNLWRSEDWKDVQFEIV